MQPVNPIVRTKVRMLRSPLERYYSSQGLFYAISIEMPKCAKRTTETPEAQRLHGRVEAKLRSATDKCSSREDGSVNIPLALSTRGFGAICLSQETLNPTAQHASDMLLVARGREKSRYADSGSVCPQSG